MNVPMKNIFKKRPRLNMTRNVRMPVPGNQKLGMQQLKNNPGLGPSTTSPTTTAP